MVAPWCVRQEQKNNRIVLSCDTFLGNFASGPSSSSNGNCESQRQRPPPECRSLISVNSSCKKARAAFGTDTEDDGTCPAGHTRNVQRRPAPTWQPGNGSTISARRRCKATATIATSILSRSGAAHTFATQTPPQPELAVDCESLQVGGENSHRTSGKQRWLSHFPRYNRHPRPFVMLRVSHTQFRMERRRSMCCSCTGSTPNQTGPCRLFDPFRQHPSRRF